MEIRPEIGEPGLVSLPGVVECGLAFQTEGHGSAHNVNLSDQPVVCGVALRRPTGMKSVI